MKVFIYISTKIAFKSALLWGWKISNKNILYCMSCKQKRKKYFKKDLKYVIECLCSSTTEILNIPYQSIYFIDGFTSQHFHDGWQQKVLHTSQSSSWKMQVYLSLYVVLVPPVMKRLIRFMFMTTLSTVR